MKVLITLPQSPAPSDNTVGRYFGPMLKAMVALGHEVTAVAVCHTAKAQADAESYLAGSGVRLRPFREPPPRPLIERKLRSLWRSGWELCGGEFGKAVREEAARDYDVILAEMAQTARIVEKDPRTVLSVLFLRFMDLATDRTGGWLASEARRLQSRRAELSTCRKVRRVRVISSRLGAALRDIRSDSTVIPICLDASTYTPVKQPSQPTVGVLGSMFWAPSRAAAIHFIKNIAPPLRGRFPGIRFLVGGWRAREFLGPHIKHPDIDLLNNFPDPREAFARLSVLVYAPPVGTGMKVKVLESMAYGVPAVVNDEGFEGLDVDPSPPVSLARSDDEIVDAVAALLTDVTARERVIEEGRRCLARSFSPMVVTESLARYLSRGCSI